MEGLKNSIMYTHVPNTQLRSKTLHSPFSSLLPPEVTTILNF